MASGNQAVPQLTGGNMGSGNQTTASEESGHLSSGNRGPRDRLSQARSAQNAERPQASSTRNSTVLGDLRPHVIPASDLSSISTSDQQTEQAHKELSLADNKITAFTLRRTSRKRQTAGPPQQQETETETAEATGLTTRILIFTKLQAVSGRREPCVNLGFRILFKGRRLGIKPPDQKQTNTHTKTVFWTLYHSTAPFLSNQQKIQTKVNSVLF